MAAMGQGLVQLFPLQQHLPQIAVSFCELWLEFQGQPEVRESAGFVSLATEGIAQVVAGHCKAGPEAKCQPELGDSLAGLSPGQQDQAKAVGRLGIVRLKAQGRPAAIRRVIEPAKCPVDLGQIGVVCGGIRVQGDGPADHLGGPVVLALLVCEDTEQMQGVGAVLGQPSGGSDKSSWLLPVYPPDDTEVHMPSRFPSGCHL